MIPRRNLINTSKTSVVVTTYNDAEYLERSLPSIINQSLKPIEVIIIDDGSDNDDAEIITNSYIDKTEIPIIHKKKENGGPSSARNYGINLAKGEFILFIDADDELLPNSIKWRQESLEQLGESYASIYCSRIEQSLDKSNKIIKVLESDGKLDVSLVGRINGIPGQITNHLFRKSILLNISGYNESLKFNEDFELILRIAKKWMFFGVNKVGFIQHVRNDSLSQSDPYIAFNGVEDFLEVALNNKLLPIIEINKRKKENRLSLVKKLLSKKEKWNQVKPYINEAFDFTGPQNIKEYALYIFNKFK